MRASLIRFAVAVATLTALVSCGDSTGPKRTVDQHADSLIAVMNGTNQYGGPIIDLSGGMFTGPMGSAACSYNAGNQRFECNPQTANGITVTLWYQYLDASNKPLSAYNASTVNAFRTHSTTDGKITDSFQGQTVTMTISGEGDQTLGGLLGATQTIAGTSTMTMAETGSPTVTFGTTTDLTLPPKGTQGYPTGTITMTFSEPGSPTETITMTFNGTSVITINFNGQSCTMDLSKPNDPGTCASLYSERSHVIAASWISKGVRWPPLNSR
jgi:hypothetical protein